jgi:RimJ/RimL family protein N-acetyltransferase
MENIGMKREGVWRQYFTRWDRFEDAAAYRILRDEGQP